MYFILFMIQICYVVMPTYQGDTYRIRENQHVVFCKTRRSTEAGS